MDPAKTTLHLSPVLHLEVACGEVAVVWEGGRNRGMHFLFVADKPACSKTKDPRQGFFCRGLLTYVHPRRRLDWTVVVVVGRHREDVAAGG